MFSLNGFIKQGFCVLMTLLLSSSLVLAELPIGKVPKTIVLKEKLGGRLDGSQWDSSELASGKVTALFYV